MARAAHCSILLTPFVEGGGEAFEFPVDPATIKVMMGRNVTTVPILGLGEVLLPGSLTPTQITFEAMLPRPSAYESLKSVCNYEIFEKPEETRNKLERWMGRVKPFAEGQKNPELLRVTISRSGFSRLMVLTNMTSEYRPGEPDVMYVNVTFKEWRRQAVRITQGEARPLLEEAPTGTGSGLLAILEGGRYPDRSIEDLRRDYIPPISERTPTNLPARHRTKSGDTFNSLANHYFSGVDNYSERYFADRLYNLNKHKWEPGGVYYEKYEYKNVRTEQIVTKPAFWSIGNLLPFLGGGDQKIVGSTVQKTKKYTPYPVQGRYYQALPAGVFITLRTDLDEQLVDRITGGR